MRIMTSAGASKLGRRSRWRRWCRALSKPLTASPQPILPALPVFPTRPTAADLAVRERDTKRAAITAKIVAADAKTLDAILAAVDAVAVAVAVDPIEDPVVDPKADPVVTP